jgi:hypothetical protein
MIHNELIIEIRTVLLLQLIVMTMASDRAVLVHQELRKIWKTLNAPVLPKKPAPANKGRSFWEIDMTKFEP